jgi:hypothetical protein
MSITIDLSPDIERGLLVQAQAKGVSLSEFLQEMVSRNTTPIEYPSGTGQELLDIGARVRGLLTDDEVDTLFARNRSASRTVDLG